MAQAIRTTVPSCRVEVITNCSDNELFSAPAERDSLPEWTAGKSLVLYTGTIGYMDDCAQILDLAAVLQQRSAGQVQLVLIGDGAERAELEQRVRDQGLSNICFAGLLPKHEVVTWLGHACCALMVFRDVPINATVSPNKMFDAFAAGIPVVQTTQGWIRELLESEQCGLTIPANDAEAMADAVLSLVQDTNLLSVYAANARRAARELFDRDLLAGKMRSLLHDAAGAGHGRD
jgi:glycosyltransferase involved in cell wall biosynthesis